MTDLMKENKLLDAVTSAFKIKGKVIRDRRVEVYADKNTVSSILLFAKKQLGYIHLAHMTCIDWIDQGEFEMIYMIYSPVEKITLFVKTRIDRENPVMENIDTIWDQANTYEREMREMFGIEFPGLIGEHDFILEDWDQIPPMRKEFDTHKYAAETFFTRPGREDAKDVRDEISKRSGTDVPDFAKKYSRES
ncbi:MAG: NADH-quinone oxidoreductase subunit C [Flavobacteriaceae bacterium]|nr:NADH-quinone oxidoreductase subunit C [Flavobacteriaceae bacterium]